MKKTIYILVLCILPNLLLGQDISVSFTSAGNPDGSGLFEKNITPTPGSENTDVSPNLIAPYQIAPGDIFPVIVRVTDQNGNINREVSTTLTLSSSQGTVEPSRIKIRHGVGTLSVKVNTTEDFDLSVSGYNYSREIKVNANIPKEYLSGTLREDKYLLSGIDYLINSTLIIDSAVVLYVLPGARLLIDEKINLRSKGVLKFEGSLSKPIVVMPKDKGEVWGGMKFQDHDFDNVFKWTIFTGGGGDSTKSQAHSKTQPVLYPQSTNLVMDQCFMVDNTGKAMYSQWSDIYINNSVFSRCDTGPETDVCRVNVYNSWFLDLPIDKPGRVADDDNDGIYIENRLKEDDPPHILQSCVFYGTDDDAFDMRETNAVVSDCIFSKNFDKGISAGHHSDIIVERCLFYDNAIAASATYSAIVYINQSTFSKNNQILYSKEEGGGIVRNSILSEHSKKYAADSSDLNLWYFEYCLSDSDPDLLGKNNLYGSPGFVNLNAGDFHLFPGSMAINAGNPNEDLDADGTPADLGMYSYDGRTQKNLVISELYYNPPSAQGNDEIYEFLEIINPGSELISLSGYSLIDGIDFIFPENSSISPGEIILVAADAFTYQNLPVQVFEWAAPGTLSNSGERIALVNNNGQLEDEVTYLNQNPWPLTADGDGYSIELPNAKIDNSIGLNWVPSSKWGGSPGELNLVHDYDKISLNEIMVNNSRSEKYQYNGYESWVEVYNDGVSNIDLGGCVFTLENGSSYKIPVGSVDLTTVPTKGYVVFVFNSTEILGANHIPLNWDTTGDKLTLSRLSEQGIETISEIDVNTASSSWGRYPDGDLPFYLLPDASPGYANSLASPDLITMKTMMTGERLPVILWKHDLSVTDLVERNAAVQVIKGIADLRDTRFPMIEGVGSMVSKVDATEDFTIEVGEWGDTAGVRVADRRHIYEFDDYLLFDMVWTPDHDYYIIDDLSIRPGVTITILPGTRVFLEKEASIKVYGSLKVIGNKANPVLFAPIEWSNPWGQIMYYQFSDESSMEYAIFIGGGGNKGMSNGHTGSQAVISSSGADLNLKNCFILDNPGKGIYVKEGTLNLESSLISNSDAGIDGKDALLMVNNSYFTFLPDQGALEEEGENDAIYAVGEGVGGSQSRISNCVAAYVRDDAIDIYEGANTIAIGGKFLGIGDKVASVTEADLDISFSIIQKSYEGLVSKESSSIAADHITFYQNDRSLMAYSNNANKGYGIIDVENSIIFGSTAADVYVETGSEITVSYTLSNSRLHEGIGNIEGDPLFRNTSNGDFSLQGSSPAKNSGNPESPFDNDGSRTDMGAIVGENSSPSHDGVIINEFMARNTSTIQDDTGEYVDWLELYNPSDNFIQLNGLYLSKYEDNLLYYKIDGPDNEMLLAPGEYMLFWLDDNSDIGPNHASFELAGSGGFIALSKPIGNSISVLDSVSYTSMSADVSLGRFPDASSNWIKFEKPTPGSTNNITVGKVTGLHINEILARNSSVFLNDIGEYDDWIELYNSSNEDINIGGLYFSDNESDPFKYQIPKTSPAKTIVRAKGFFMLFPSGKPESSIHHLNFQLSGSGEHVSIAQLYLGETVIIDSVNYPGLGADKSWGNTNDGGPYWKMFDTPTPNATNGTSAILDLESDFSQVSIYPNPATERVYIRFSYHELFSYRIDVISPLSQSIRVVAQENNQFAYSQVSLSFDIRELGVNSESYFFFRISINGHNYYKKVLITGL